MRSNERVLLDASGERLAVAGVPPDYFSESGQLSGNPLYDWAALAEVKHAFWVERMRRMYELCDVVRIDHFRAFCSYWSVPAGAKDARGDVLEEERTRRGAAARNVPTRGGALAGLRVPQPSSRAIVVGGARNAVA